MANVGPNVWYVRDNAPTSTIGWSAVPAWAATTAKTAGQLVRQLAAPTVGNERVFACIIAGTTLGAEPTWVVTKGAKTAEAAGPTWQEVTGQPGVNGDTTNSPTWLQNKNVAVTLGLIIYDSVSASLQIVSTAGTTGNGAAPTFSATAGTTTADNTVTWTSLGLASGFAAWAAPFARLQSVFGTSWAQPSATVYVGDDHAETQSSAMTITVPTSTNAITSVYCVDHTISLPPTSSNLKTTASITTTGASGITLNGFQCLYAYGLIFNAGSGATNAAINIGSTTNEWWRFDSCAFNKLGTNANTTAISFGAANIFEFNNVTVQFGNTGDGISANGCLLKWKNTAAAITGATLPTILFGRQTGNNQAQVVLDGVDLSAMTSGTIFGGSPEQYFLAQIINCKLAAGVTVAATPTLARASIQTDLIVSDSSSANYRQERYWFQGTLVASTSLVRTGGASDGTTALSWQISTSANAVWLSPFESFPISIWNAVTATNRVVTIAGTYKGAALPKNDEIWLEVEYLGNASFPTASFATQTKANGLATGSALSADTASDWTGQAAAYQTANAYGSFTGLIKAGNATPQQVFFMASHAGTGTSGGSSAIFNGIADGAQVTDNAGANQIVWQAMMRFTLSVTLSSPQPQLAGVMRATVKAALASTTWWADPSPTLS